MRLSAEVDARGTAPWCKFYDSNYPSRCATKRFLNSAHPDEDMIRRVKRWLRLFPPFECEHCVGYFPEYASSCYCWYNGARTSPNTPPRRWLIWDEATIYTWLS